MNKFNNKPIKWQRVLLKVIGKALARDHFQNIDPKKTMAIAREIAVVTRIGIKGWQAEKPTPSHLALPEAHPWRAGPPRSV
ncbi:hypothetical protein AHAS_Ahas09G0123200 [Arachis hypogaea]